MNNEAKLARIELNTFVTTFLSNSRHVNLDHSFDENGGDSLSFVTFMINFIQTFPDIHPDQTFGIRSPLKELLPNEDIVVNARKGVAPLLSAASRIRPTANRFSYLSRMHDEKDKWIVLGDVYRIGKEVSFEEIVNSVEALKKRHINLNSTFKLDSNKVKQKIELRSEYLLVTSEAQAGDDLRNKISSTILQARSKITMKRNPWIFAAVPVSDGTHICTFLLHHAIADGITKGIIETDFLQRVISPGVRDTLLNSPNYLDYIDDYYETLSSNSEKAYEYWNSFPWSLTKTRVLNESERQINTESSTETFFVDFTLENVNSTSTMKHKDLHLGIVLGSLEGIANWKGSEHSTLGLAYHGRSINAFSRGYESLCGWLSDTCPIFYNKSRSRQYNIKYVRGQMDKLDTFGLSYNFLKYLAPNKLRSNVFATYTESEFTLNIKTREMAKVSHPKFHRLTLKELPKMLPVGKRAIPLAGGAVLTGNNLRISWDFSNNLYSSANVKLLMNLTKSALEKHLPLLGIRVANISPTLNYATRENVSKVNYPKKMIK